MKDKARKPTTTPGSEPPSAEGAELPERWSVQRKTELILRLLRGEALDAVSRESQVPAHELESWKRVFLEQGARGLKTRSDLEERELTLARAKIHGLRPHHERGRLDVHQGHSLRLVGATQRENSVPGRNERTGCVRSPGIDVSPKRIGGR